MAEARPGGLQWRKDPQAIATRGVAVRTHPQCKICQSPWRGEIEDVFAMKQSGEDLPNGERITERWLFENSQRLWKMPLNSNNLHSHFKSHFRQGAVTEIRKQQAGDLRTKMNQLVADGAIEKVSVEVFLEQIVALGYARALADPSTVTVDMALKAVAELTKRKHDEQTASLMGTLVDITQTALSKVPGESAPEVDIVDAEVVDDAVEDGGSGVRGEPGDRSVPALGLPGRSPENVPLPESEAVS